MNRRDFFIKGALALVGAGVGRTFFDLGARPRMIGWDIGRDEGSRLWVVTAVMTSDVEHEVLSPPVLKVGDVFTLKERWQ